MDFPIITCFYEILRLTNTGLMYDLQILFDFRLSSLLDKRNWTEFTLNETEIHTALVVNFVVLVAMWLIIQLLYGEKKVYSSTDKEEDKKLRKKARRKLSWVPTFINSLFLTIMGTVYFIIKSDCLNDISGIWTYGQGDGEYVWRNMDNVSVLTMAWFAMFNIFDIIIGIRICCSN